MSTEVDFYNYNKLTKACESLAFGEVLLIVGDTCKGKTRFAHRFCSTHKQVLFLPFKGYDVSLIPSLMISEHKSWNEYLSNIIEVGEYDYLLIDDADCGKNSVGFWTALNELCKNGMKLKIILTANEEIRDMPEHKTAYLTLRSWKALSDHLDISGKEIKELLCITGCFPEIMAEYKRHCPLEETLNLLLEPGSAFATLAPRLMAQHFNTVDTYNTILYAIALGNNTLTDIAKLAGMKYNACLEYLKNLQSKGFVRSRDPRKGPREFYITNSYLYLWYLFVYDVRRRNGSADIKEISADIDLELRKNIYPRFLRRLFIDYAGHQFHYLDIPSGAYDQDKDINGIYYDYVGDNGDYKVFLKCGYLKTEDVTKATNVLRKIPFYNKQFVFFFTNKSIPQGCWTLSKTYDNIYIVQEKSLYRMLGVPCE